MIDQVSSKWECGPFSERVIMIWARIQGISIWLRNNPKLFHSASFFNRVQLVLTPALIVVTFFVVVVTPVVIAIRNHPFSPQ